MSGIPDISTTDDPAELVEAWGETLQMVEGRAPKTASKYCGAVRRFLTDSGVARVDGLTREAIERHIKRLAYTGVGRSRVGSVLISIRGFCGWLVAHGRLERNPARELRSPKPYRKAKRPLTEAEVRRLFWGDGGLPSSRKELVATVAFAVAYCAALRPGEICGLRGDELEWDPDRLIYSVLIRKGKHAKEDIRLPLDRTTSRLLGAYLQQRAALSAGPFLFPSTAGPQLSEEGVRKLFSALVRARGIEAKGRSLTPKILRISRCTHMLHRALRAGHHPKAVQEFMRHASIETTFEHYSWIDDDSGLRLVLDADPISSKKRPPFKIGGPFGQLLDQFQGDSFVTPRR